MAQDYNASIHLPETDFPMRGSLPRREPERLKTLEDREIYSRLMKKNREKPTFLLHDGPPYANGDIHIGHAMNKILKDMIIRSKNMMGYRAPYVPGWDTHGLPIESAILKNKKIHRDKMTTGEFREKCREYAESFVDRQREEFRRLGVIGDWEHPYRTLTPDFEAAQIRVFGAMAEQGFIYKGLKPVYWCPQDQTALAEAEIEYAQDPCTTIFVKFPVTDDRGCLTDAAPLEKISFVIWTTTPWTIPGNMAICVGPDFSYVLAEIPSGEVLVLAEDLLAPVMKAAGIADYRVLKKLPGRALEGVRTRHPLYERESPILLGDHVTLDAGTGCVHTAPGFGAEDFAICQKYDREQGTNLGTPVPVNAKGVMTDSRYAGQFYAKGNDLVVEDLAAAGALLAREEITHAYPHCWRCKHPIIYRATEQWFCSVDALKEKAIAACENIWWKPEWGKERMISMIAERNDWCISRQRVWGVPIPIFYCDGCGRDIVTPQTIDHVADTFAREGSNAWFMRPAAELLPEGFVCPHCGGAAFTKETDIMDVWFDSGSTHAAVLSQNPDLGFPADLYLEGGDQYRGWFQSSMLTAIATRGAAPYRQIVTHGWTVDGEGHAMHKSLGNTVAPQEIIKDYGADILRLWASSTDYTQDARISPAIMKQLSQAYLKIRNTARYLLGNLKGYAVQNPCPHDKLQPIDRWALSRLGELLKTCYEAYRVYEFHTVYRNAYQFCVVDLSNFYFNVLKDRLYCGDEAGRHAAQTTLYTILRAMTKLLAPILAFTAEEIWASMAHLPSDEADSVLLNEMEPIDPAWTLNDAERQYFDALLALREEVNRALETAREQQVVGKSLEAAVEITLPQDSPLLGETEETLADLLIVSQLRCQAGTETGVQVTAARGDKCPRCWKQPRSHRHAELCDRCAAVLGL